MDYKRVETSYNDGMFGVIGIKNYKKEIYI